VSCFYPAHNLCPTLGCQAGCHASPTGGGCTCPDGYRLDDRFHRTCSGACSVSEKLMTPIFFVLQISTNALNGAIAISIVRIIDPDSHAPVLAHAFRYE
jgi:hypothetical protein